MLVAFVLLFVSTLQVEYTLSKLGTEFRPYYLNYLYSKGYLATPNKLVGTLQTQETIIDSLKLFQEFAGIPPTGLIDDATIRKFHQPRCGMSDVRPRDTRAKRYVLNGEKWHKKTLTYRILNYSSDLTRAQIHQSVRRAFSRWEAASQLRFHEIHDGVADMMIKFARGRHDDPYEFDGPGGTLAHAFYPGEHELAGDTHFDQDESFTLKSEHGKNFYWVALHEFGHALGLEHSILRGTIMYPWYSKKPGEDYVDLSQDDKNGIQALYGKPIGSTDTFITTQSTSPVVCINRANVIVPSDGLETVVINNDKVYVFDDDMVLKIGPVELSTYYEGVHYVNAAFKLDNGRTILLSGSSYWEFRGRVYIHGPEHVSSIGFHRNMNDIDSAFRWERNGKIYLFKGRYYWRYNSDYNRVDLGYPKLIIDSWNGVPNSFDSVFQWSRNKKVYFMKGPSYYRYNDRRFEVSKGYPVNINRFFKCQKTLEPRISKLEGHINSSRSSFKIPSRKLIVFILIIVQMFGNHLILSVVS